jgi:hypothetical protein
MRAHRYLVAAAVVLALGGAKPALAAELRAYAGAVGGRVQGPGGFACQTGGYTIPEWAAGIGLPLEGFATCGLFGGIDDKTVASGPVASTQSLTAPVLMGTFTGSSRASADYGRLGVFATGTSDGEPSAGVYSETAGFARFEDELTIASPSVTTGTAGVVTFSFVVVAQMSSVSTGPGYLDAQLELRLGGPSGNIFGEFLATISSTTSLPFVRGATNGVPGTLVIALDSVSGSTELTTQGFGFQWGVPFSLETVLRANDSPCCFGTSMTADFSTGTRLSGIHASISGGPEVTDFTVTSGSGTHYSSSGVPVTPVPLPPSYIWLEAVTLLCGGQWLLRRHGAKTASAN